MKNLFYKLLLLLVFSGAFHHLQAQDSRQTRQERFQKIQNYKISYLTSKLDLSPDQAQKFWPIYNQYDGERHRLRHQTRIIRDDKLSALSEQELQEKLRVRFTAQQQMLDLEKQYMERFLKVISYRQLAILYRSEEEFPRILLEKLHAERTP